MQIEKNILINGNNNLPITIDIFFEEKNKQCPVIIYAHGFNGFKDWGNFDLVAEKFAKENFVFVKFNFSHNGTTPEQQQEFVELEAFGNNNYTKELYDLARVIDWICNPLNDYNTSIDTNNISVIGHSMGAGIALLHAWVDRRIKKLVSWAGISECKTPWGSWPAEKMEQWKTTGVQYYTNSRTNQQMPLYYQLYQDYLQNTAQLDIEKAIKNLPIPVLICHGTLDTAVPVEKAFDLKKWQPAAEIFTLETDHVFGRRHPWPGKSLPKEMETVIEKTMGFLK